MGQILVEPACPQANLRRAVDAIRQAASQGCRLVVLPECLDVGWGDPSARDLAQPIPGSHVRELQEAARWHRIHVAAGPVERAGKRLFNAAVLIAPTGDILLHDRKISELDICLDLCPSRHFTDRLACARRYRPCFSASPPSVWMRRTFARRVVS
jgi:predicted amidohydrolase